MCGIFGLVTDGRTEFSPGILKSIVSDLFLLSESRGKEAAGIAVRCGRVIHVYKEPVKASLFIRKKKYDEIFDSITGPAPFAGNRESAGPVAVIGHSRLVTDGSREANCNNHPLVKDGLAGVHNGIIVNAQALWKHYPTLQRNFEVDTEILLSLLRFFYRENHSWPESTRRTFQSVQGAASVAVLFQDAPGLLLATNNGSLYTGKGGAGHGFIFASERNILERFIRQRRWKKRFGPFTLGHLHARRACWVSYPALKMLEFDLGELPVAEALPVTDEECCEIRLWEAESSPQRFAGPATPGPKKTDWENAVSSLRGSVERLKRCTKCLLPETMPFIHYDADGVCHYCRSHRPLVVQDLRVLEERIGRFRSQNGEPDCLVGVSGGRDSTYGLHFIKKNLKMNPVAFTYDWGMVTDLARRNISRICGRLGIEHIVVSADIEMKRRFIRKNVEAWLKKPCLGLVPLFMAGDKQYFSYARQVRKQLGVRVAFFCENMLERTDFKTGFCGIPPERSDEDHVYTLSSVNKIKLGFYYLNRFLSNPAYLNSSLGDTLRAYASYYFLPRDYYNLFRFTPWDEKEIIRTLVEQYGWESAGDTSSTWRIGDGTAAFYNYIYYMLAGFTEHDAFRSNQIREGLLTRAEALRLVKEENKPRYESIAGYCDQLGLDFDKVMSVIHSAPKCPPLDRLCAGKVL
jgi:hypothetical protein